MATSPWSLIFDEARPKICRTLRLFGKHSFGRGFDCRDCPTISGDRLRQLFEDDAYYGQSAKSKKRTVSGNGSTLPGALH
jgi:hypothetical protein